MLGFMLGVAVAITAAFLLWPRRSAGHSSARSLADELSAHAHGTVSNALSVMADAEQRLATDRLAYQRHQDNAASLVALGFGEADRLFHDAAARVPLREMDNLRRCHRAARREVLLSAINLHGYDNVSLALGRYNQHLGEYGI